MATSTSLDPSHYTQLYLNGEYTDATSAHRLTLINPKDNSLVTDRVPNAGSEDVDRAVQYAEAAFKGPLW
jgi:acyl-CoA reductase-like NAD-dependent aldehyde dehydrogenase